MSSTNLLHAAPSANGGRDPGDRLPFHERLDVAREAAAQVSAWQARLVGAVEDCLDEPIVDGWRSYLAWQLGLTPGEAGQVLELVDRLSELPRTRALLGSGARSLASVLSLARRATPATEATILARSEHLTGGQLQRLLAEYEQIVAPSRRDDLNPAHDEADPPPSSGRVRRRDGRTRVVLDLDASDAAAWQRAVEAERDRLVEVAGEWVVDPRERTYGAAVMAMVDRAMGTRVDAAGFLPERFTTSLVIHARETADGLVVDRAFLPGEAVAPWALGMLVEQGTLSATIAVHGTPVLAIEPVRFATAAQRRALLVRDRGCAYPSCGATSGLIAHHIRPWDQGGPTRLENLVLLCRRHHRVVHRHALTIARDPDAPPREHRWVFTNPDGRPLDPAWPRPPDQTRCQVAARQRGTHEPLTAYARDVLLHRWLTPAA